MNTEASTQWLIKQIENAIDSLDTIWYGALSEEIQAVAARQADELTELIHKIRKGGIK